MEKKLLFENSDSLFQQLKNYPSPLPSISIIELTRDIVAATMRADEIHQDVHQFFHKLSQLIQ